MKKFVFSLLSLLFSLIVFAQSQVTIPANDPLIEYTGRIDFKDPLLPGFNYSGVSIRAAFQGTSISFKLKDDGTRNFYNVIIDHTVVKRIQTMAGLQTYAVASNLKDTVHQIELFKLTETTFGKSYFAGFVTDFNRALVELSDQRPRLIEYIGNSITCGYGNEGVNGEQFGPTTENHYLTYAAFTSRNFNARHLAVCRSGIGIYRNYDGPVTGSTDNMTDLYQRIFINEAAPLYAFTQKPDLVCIDLGTNDFSTNKGDSALYVSNYFKLIRTIQQKYNGADILCLQGPMMGGTALTKVRKYLQFIADSANRYNNGKVSFFEMSAQTGAYGLGIDWHPTVAQHLQNSKELTAYISTLKGWAVSPIAQSAAAVNGAEVIITCNTPLQDPSGMLKGFKLTDQNGEVFEISSTSIDAADKCKVHLMLQRSLPYQSTVTVSYHTGTFESTAGEKLQEFSQLPVVNKLTETKLMKATVVSSGTRVMIYFNKTILLPASFSLIRVTNQRNEVIATSNLVKLSTTSLGITISPGVFKGDTVYISIPGGVFGSDMTEITPVVKFQAANQSTITGIGALEALQCSVFPNPAINRMISYTIQDSGNAFKATLLSLQGSVILSRQLTSSQGIIDLSAAQVPSGAYLLRISSNGKEFTAKIVL